MNPKDYFLDQLSISELYQPELVLHLPFWEFMYRIESLNRYWTLNKTVSSKHIEILTNAGKANDESAEYYDMFWETAKVDIEYFPELLRSSTLSIALSFLETLLESVSTIVAKDLDVEINYDKRDIPYIHKYILWLTKGCGLQVAISKENNKRLDAIRAVRNRYIHQIDRDLPENIKKTVSEMINSSSETEMVINDDFVDQALNEICSLVKVIELSYIRFYDNLKKSNK